MLNENEFLKPEYISGILTPAPLYRAELNKDRIYYNAFGTYIGATTLAEAVIPKNNIFQKWYRAHPNPEAHAKEKALYGTLMHILIGNFCKNKTITMDSIYIIVRQSVREERLINLFIEGGYNEHGDHYIGLKKNLLSFAQFIYDYKLTIIAVELPVFSTAKKIATQCDIVASAKTKIKEKDFFGETFKNGKPKKTTRVISSEKIFNINLKSGKNIYDENTFQLYIEKKGLYETYKINAACYNWLPLDYEVKPSYRFRSGEKDIIENSKRYSVYLDLAEDVLRKKLNKVKYSYDFSELKYLEAPPVGTAKRLEDVMFPSQQ